MSCYALDFGQVALGAAESRTVTVQNVSLAPARFGVDTVSKPWQLQYSKVPVPAGLRTKIEVRVCSEEPGTFECVLVVRSPCTIQRCPIRVCVLERA
jgi:Flagellar-associated PapD-like